MPMTLLIASDTHGRADRLLEAFRRCTPAAVLFLGDGLRDLSYLPQNIPVHAVRGNCDWSIGEDAPPTRVLQIGGYRLFLTHGHLHGVKLQLDAAIAAAAAADADVLLYGHTHVASETYLSEENGGPLWLFCPGSLGHPADGAPSYGLLMLDEGGVLFSVGREA